MLFLSGKFGYSRSFEMILHHCTSYNNIDKGIVCTIACTKGLKSVDCSISSFWTLFWRFLWESGSFMVQNDHEQLFNPGYFNSEIHSECQTRYLTVLNQGLLISDHIYLILMNNKAFWIVLQTIHVIENPKINTLYSFYSIKFYSMKQSLFKCTQRTRGFEVFEFFLKTSQNYDLHQT